MAGQAVRDYLREVESKLATGVAVEHSYRPALELLLRKLGAVGLVVLNESKRVKAGQPDFVVKQKTGFGLVDVGHVEAKDIGEIDGKIERTDQMKRYLAELPNLVLTDYLEFRHYVNGKLRESARMATVGAGGKLVRDEAGEETVERMLVYFLRTKPQEITSAEDLAKRMAFLTRYIRDAIVADYAAGAPSNKVREWRKRLAKDLITDLEQPQKTEEFADMFAQTLAYGLFSARTMDRTPGDFSIAEAQRLIPPTNPFLQEFFYEITGPSMESETFAPFVRDLEALLAYTKMDMVLEDFGKGREGHDPVIHFYETFLAAYDPKLREARGVYYTPEPVVQYIVRSVDWLLKEKFGLRDGLGSRERFRDENKDPNLRLAGDRTGMRQTVMRHRVQVLDPACGTGTFLFAMVNLIRERMMARWDAGEWSDYVREDLLPRMFGFELLMAPYAVAHFKLGLQLAGGDLWDLPEGEREKWRYDFSSNERLNVFLTNTLEEAHSAGATPMFDVVGRESVEADAVKRDLPILVVMGNPPYSGHSSNNGKWIMGLLRGKDGANDTVNYFEVDGKPLGEKNPKWLNDDYVKFIRFAQWRIDKTEQGVLAFISNNGYLDNPTFRGMRQALMETFTDIYILDLHGNSNKKEVAPDGSKDENVFDIQQGVAIGIFVKEAGKAAPARVHHADLWGLREQKYAWLLGHDVEDNKADRIELEPQAPSYLFVPQSVDLRTEYYAYWGLTDIFPVSNAGIVTARDSLTIHWNEGAIWQTVNDFVALPPEEARIKYNLGDDVRDWKVEFAQKDLRVPGLSKGNLARLLYRPFDIRHTYYTGVSRGFHCMPRGETMRHMLKGANLALITTRQTRDQWDALATNLIIGHKALAAYDINSIFPLYLYPDERQMSFAEGETSKRRANLNPEFVEEMASKVGLRYVGDGKGDLEGTFGPEDVFDYMYAVFHSPTYRERYAEFLKIDFPRVPVAGDVGLFRRLCGYGERLVGLHLMTDDGRWTMDDGIGVSWPVPGSNEVEKVWWEEGEGVEADMVFPELEVDEAAFVFVVGDAVADKLAGVGRGGFDGGSKLIEAGLPFFWGAGDVFVDVFWMYHGRNYSRWTVDGGRFEKGGEKGC